MSTAETMTKAYLEAIYFTETGDDSQPSTDAVITPLCKARAFIDCRNFLRAIGAVPGSEGPVDGCHDLNPAQLGHDLWLTRNGHGVGYWDRPELYGDANATLFTRLARAMGEHDAEFLDES